MDKNQKKVILGGVFVALGIIIGWTVAIVWCLCGGIIDILGFEQGGSVDFWLLVWGVIKVCAATPVGAFIITFFIVPGWNMIDYNF